MLSFRESALCCTAAMSRSTIPSSTQTPPSSTSPPSLDFMPRSAKAKRERYGGSRTASTPSSDLPSELGSVPQLSPLRSQMSVLGAATVVVPPGGRSLNARDTCSGTGWSVRRAATRVQTNIFIGRAPGDRAITVSLPGGIGVIIRSNSDSRNVRAASLGLRGSGPGLGPQWREPSERLERHRRAGLVRRRRRTPRR